MNIFDFEQEMMNCWAVVDDIRRLQKNMEYMDEDTIDNYLLGLETIYEIKFQNLQAGFEDLAREYHQRGRGLINQDI